MIKTRAEPLNKKDKFPNYRSTQYHSLGKNTMHKISRPQGAAYFYFKSSIHHSV